MLWVIQNHIRIKVSPICISRVEGQSRWQGTFKWRRPSVTSSPAKREVQTVNSSLQVSWPQDEVFPSEPLTSRLLLKALVPHWPKNPYIPFQGCKRVWVRRFLTAQSLAKCYFTKFSASSAESWYSRIQGKHLLMYFLFITVNMDYLS